MTLRNSHREKRNKLLEYIDSESQSQKESQNDEILEDPRSRKKDKGKSMKKEKDHKESKEDQSESSEQPKLENEEKIEEKLPSSEVDEQPKLENENKSIEANEESKTDNEDKSSDANVQPKIENEKKIPPSIEPKTRSATKRKCNAIVNADLAKEEKEKIDPKSEIIIIPKSLTPKKCLRFDTMTLENPIAKKDSQKKIVSDDNNDFDLNDLFPWKENSNNSTNDINKSVEQILQGLKDLESHRMAKN